MNGFPQYDSFRAMLFIVAGCVLASFALIPIRRAIDADEKEIHRKVEAETFDHPVSTNDVVWISTTTAREKMAEADQR